MHSKTFTIGLLSLTATVMATALLVTPSAAIPAGVVVRERDYTLMTAAAGGGGDALYVVDNRRGLVAVLTYDNAARGLRLRASAPVARAFPGGNVPAPR